MELKDLEKYILNKYLYLYAYKLLSFKILYKHIYTLILLYK